MTDLIPLPLHAVSAASATEQKVDATKDTKEAPAAASPAPAASAAEESKPAAANAEDKKPSTDNAEATPAAAAPAAAAAGAAATPSGNAQPSPSSSLYVGELDPTVTEAMLYEIFSMIGPVASIRVCRDAVTRRSLGYAYVNFLNAPDGERALEQLNYSLIKNRPCRIMWSQRDPALRKTGAGNIFIKNLDENIDNKALHDTFAAFGNILSCKVATDPQGNSLGYGFVHYDAGEAAQAAIEGVNGMLLNDKIVFVGIHIPRRERQAKIDEIRSKYTNLYVKNIPLDLTQEEFENLFKPFGNVTSAVISLDNEGKSKGFGFVNFEKHDEAHKAVMELHEKEIKGQQIYVARAQHKSEREEELKKSYEQKKYETTLKYQGVNLYVKNLDDDVTEEKLQAEFEPFGQITSCKIMADDKGVSKGFGFVCFSSPDEATKAVNELNGKMISSKPLYVSLAQRKDVRKQQLEQQVQQRNQVRSQQIQAAGMGGMPPVGAPYGPGGVMGGPAGLAGAPMGYYPGPAGYPQPGGPRGGPMGPYGGPGGPGGMPRPRFYAPPNMPGMPPMAGPGGPYGQVPPQQFNGGAAGPYGGVPSQQGGRPGGPIPQPGPGGRPLGAGPQGGVPQQPPRGAAVPPRQGGYKGTRAAQGPDGQASNPDGTPSSQPPQSAGLTAALLANAAPQEQKQMLGEALYPKIHASQPDLAGKITGMLLEMDSSELIYLLENDEALGAKIQEAIEVLDAFNRSNTTAPAEA
ncbi:BZ3500_MvSof-1268-A1-R1_Chr1-1g01261 [Microbotryum saponariae]|uniref:Polyadenylate-binding protein n=1 Tax=Microbotryum saponariae TaxID=289078 RepID=A0A2X0MHN5_9BASI|nr:BZ3500_MvSof-1268-A1-R1_Chr1-1g01261 [Microbotryum saponariae]SCZ93820.1 BZ3501_MvSof-1269-A2-R1_Chr1-1g00857 [Microbotryum saponariae]